MDFHFFWSWKSLGKVIENTFWKRVVTLLKGINVNSGLNIYCTIVLSYPDSL